MSKIRTPYPDRDPSADILLREESDEEEDEEEDQQGNDEEDDEDEDEGYSE